MNSMKFYSINALSSDEIKQMQMDFCVSILNKYMEWYLVVIEKLYNDSCLIYIFIVEVIYGIKKIPTNPQYKYRFKELRDQFLLVLIKNTHENVHFLYQVKWKFQDVVQLIQKQ